MELSFLILRWVTLSTCFIATFVRAEEYSLTIMAKSCDIAGDCDMADVRTSVTHREERNGRVFYKEVIANARLISVHHPYEAATQPTALLDLSADEIARVKALSSSGDFYLSILGKESLTPAPTTPKLFCGRYSFKGQQHDVPCGASKNKP